MKCSKPFYHKINGFQKLIACGKCINCRKLKTNDWSNRLSDHLSIYPESSFVTITYKENSTNDALKLYSLSIYELQLFIKRLRKDFSDRYISYFASGEYGKLSERPHYHIILFNVPLRELELYKIGKLNVSGRIEKLWKHGFNTVGKCENNSIRYVTGYVLKKAWGHHGKELYDDVGREAPFQLVSKNVGFDYFYKNYNKIKQDYWDGKPITRYYIKMLNEIGARRGTLFNSSREEIKLIEDKKVTDMNSAKKRIIERNDQLEVDYLTLTKMFTGEHEL